MYAPSFIHHSALHNIRHQYRFCAIIVTRVRLLHFGEQKSCPKGSREISNILLEFMMLVYLQAISSASFVEGPHKVLFVRPRENYYYLLAQACAYIREADHSQLRLATTITKT